MTEASLYNFKVKALELANHHIGEKPGEIVARASAYHTFLSDKAAAPVGATAGGATTKPGATAAGTAKPGATAGATGATAGGKPDAKAEAAKKAAIEAAKIEAAKKATAAEAAKAEAAKKAAGKGGAAKPGAANAQAVPADTKAPGGKNTYQDVVNALCKVRESISKETALKILFDDGGGVKSVRDLKPALYDTVVEGCENEITGEGGAAENEADAGAEFEDPTASPPSDDMGLPE